MEKFQYHPFLACPVCKTLTLREMMVPLGKGGRKETYGKGLECGTCGKSVGQKPKKKSRS